MLRRRTMMASGGNPWDDWVKFSFTLSADVTDFQIVDGSTNRVPDEVLAATPMAIDGVEITPTRTYNFTAGQHIVAYGFTDAQSYGWWYWVGHANQRNPTLEFPIGAKNVTQQAVVMRTFNNIVMIFHDSPPPISQALTASYVKSRTIYVPRGSESAYSFLGFTNIHTLDEL